MLKAGITCQRGRRNRFSNNFYFITTHIQSLSLFKKSISFSWEFAFKDLSRGILTKTLINLKVKPYCASVALVGWIQILTGTIIHFKLPRKWKYFSKSLKLWVSVFRNLAPSSHCSMIEVFIAIPGYSVKSLSLIYGCLSGFGSPFPQCVVLTSIGMCICFSYLLTRFLWIRLCLVYRQASLKTLP